MRAVFYFQRRYIDRELGKAYILASMSKYRGIKWLRVDKRLLNVSEVGRNIKLWKYLIWLIQD